MSQSTGLSILVIDDEPSIRRSVSLCLELEGHAVRSVGTPEDALDQARTNGFDLAYVDLRLGTRSGLDLIPELLVLRPALKIVVITAFATVETAVEAMRRGAWDYLPKPFEPSQVALAASKVLALRQTHADPASLLPESRSPLMREALHLARQVATRDATVLLRGESGTGKSVMARFLHEQSARRERPFATVSCPTLTGELLASELFGHAKGSFTGAVSDTVGRIEACEGGTLFLDEIGELPLEIQPKLLRLLQEREYERVGESRTRKADVRIVAATHVDLLDAVRHGRFREDLYWRLNVVEICLPPLRDRREDLPDLARALLSRICRGGQELTFSTQALEVLSLRDWPGNLRELGNVIERAAVLCQGSVLGAEAFNGSPTREATTGKAGDQMPLERLEELHIRRVLAGTRTLDEAATVLGIDAATLWRKRKRYGI
ncbi:MAG: sigma-54-dependent Fis family transcriptional regulator [Fibrobacteres bacterium]|jgi:NtrC-family two-component system response regulator AlgB|nr:sigma-54-dependent Fis family transcriptional regulator [Fibrobacterota bacterium]